ncbi:hypothetical protein NHG95_27975 [Pseudomonas corrugata]|uniref:hypothetical protein n=1 Tax=Pseudomonas corrugata TaxID=47879 RepID=UPI0028C47D8B|nr:hypothetical protein [Pseudomonas corrugata]MDU9036975.1 hypothetical protein [Pseudomonas corrugata]
MGEVVALPAGKARKIHIKRLKAQEKASANDKATTKPFKQRLRSFGTGCARLILAMIKAACWMVMGACASTLQALRRPVRTFCIFGAMAMAGSVVIQSMNDWKDPLITTWSICGFVFFLGFTALYDSVIASLFSATRRIKQAR